MTTKRVFVIKNQHDQYLDKHSGWLSGKDSHALFRVDHHDQALNTLLEINAKDITLRGRIMEVDVDEKRNPVVDVSEDAIALDKTTAANEEAALEESAAEEEDEDEPVEIEILNMEAEETREDLDD